MPLLHGAGAPAAALITADFDPALIGAAQAMGVPVISKPLRPAQLRALLGVSDDGRLEPRPDMG